MRIAMALAGSAALLCGCFQDSTPQRSSYLPLDYSTVFPTVHECRPVFAHDNQYQKVLVNPAAHDAYVNNSYPLPQGSVVVAEQHGDPSCGSLAGYYLMIKEKPGYDSSAADWHWQKLDINGRVEQDGKLQACSSCHAQCTKGDYLCSTP
jgi:hypothetical protein